MARHYTFEYHVAGKDLEDPKIEADYVFGYSYNRLLHTSQTKFQKMELFDTPLFGKMLKLDGNFQTSERDEFYYHEVMVHAPLCAHPNPKKVLIIGGGDGGILKNVLMHRTVKEAVMVEIDGGVVDFSKKYLPTICGNAFKDKRTRLIIGDGKKFAEETTEKFDVIILDLTDPIGPSKALYTQKFYNRLKEILNSNGILQLHMELCITRPEISRAVYKNLSACFKNVSPSSSYVPLYGTLMAFGACSQTIKAGEVKANVVEQRLRARGVKNLKLYNGKIHEALFALPNYLKKLYDR